MSPGAEGWVLILRCTECSAEDRFRGVVLSLAGDRARAAGWEVSADPAILIREAGQRGETCPKCSDVLRG